MKPTLVSIQGLSSAAVNVATTSLKLPGVAAPATNVTLVADIQKRMASAVKGSGGPDAVWTSKVLDAGIRARFGQLSWDATGTLEREAYALTVGVPNVVAFVAVVAFNLQATHLLG